MGNVSIFAAVSSAARQKALAPVSARGGWWPIVREPFTGAWQQNKELRREDMLAYHAVFACSTLIASDISKLGVGLGRITQAGIWQVVPTDKTGLVIDKPNGYQTRSQFFECWVLSKLARGNAYILKERNAQGLVIRLHVLHPDRVTPLVADNGDVYYEIAQDDLAKLEEDRQATPASEIIHDRFNCLYHPLVGISPLYAAALAITQGQNIQRNSATFFGNNSNPGGILTAPGAISDDTAKRLKDHWDANYSGANAGKVAVLGDGLKYEAMSVTATESQMIEQLRWTAEVVCSVFHVPPYMIGVGSEPAGSNVQALTQRYYNQCLQRLIKDIQSLLNLGLDVKEGMGFRFDLDSLLMMDAQTQMNVLETGLKSALIKPDEGRKRLNLPPVPGGNTVYMQQQNYSLDALAKRDARPDPFSTSGNTDPAPAPSPAQPAAEPDEDEIEDQARMLASMIAKELSDVEYA